RSGTTRSASVSRTSAAAPQHLGAPPQAAAGPHEAVAIDPGLGRAYLGLGVMAEQGNRAGEAIDWYKRGIAADEDDMDLRSALIGSLRRRGQLDEAVAEARSALAFNSKSLPVFNDLGLVYVEKGDLSMARFVFLKALGQVEGAKNNAAIRTNFGWTLYLSEEPLQARVQLQESYALDNKYLPTLVYLSHLYLDDRNYADAVPLLEEAARQEPDNYSTLVNLGIAYRGDGKLDQSKATYERALTVEPSAADPWLNLGVLLGDYYKDYDGATKAFNTYLQRGGTQKELVDSYLKDITKEKARAEKQGARDAERKKREAERLERERLLREAEKNKDGDAPPDPPPEGGDAPWGPQ
ncbi:MAG: tetratricopeptide repeat protein, partial [Myxococcota bacterium]